MVNSWSSQLLELIIIPVLVLHTFPSAHIKLTSSFWLVLVWGEREGLCVFGGFGVLFSPFPSCCLIDQISEHFDISMASRKWEQWNCCFHFRVRNSRKSINLFNHLRWISRIWCLPKQIMFQVTETDKLPLINWTSIMLKLKWALLRVMYELKHLTKGVLKMWLIQTLETISFEGVAVSSLYFWWCCWLGFF